MLPSKSTLLASIISWLRAFPDPAIVLFICMLLYIFFVTFCGLFELRWNCVGFVCLIISITIGDTIIKKFWIPLTGLTLPRFVSVSNKALDFHRWMSWIVFVFVVCFVDICGIVDHHCLHILFTIDNARFEQSPIVPNMVISKLNITVAISEVWFGNH